MSNRTTGSSVADNSAVRGFFEKQGMNNALVRRYIAGITLRDVLLVAKDFHDQKFQCAFEYLPDKVVTAEDAGRNVQSYLELIRQMSIFSVDSYVSVSLTALGLGLSEDVGRANFHKLAEEAKGRGEIYLRVESDGFEFTGRVLKLISQESRIYDQIGAVVQASLKRTENDLSLLIKDKISVRLIEGAAPANAQLGWQSKAEIDASYRKHMFFLLEHGNHPAIGTQDNDLVNFIKKFVKQSNIPKDRFEFEIPYGVRRDLQTDLQKEGYLVRIYLPYGPNWYPYFSTKIGGSGFSLKSLFGRS